MVAQQRRPLISALPAPDDRDALARQAVEAHQLAGVSPAVGGHLVVPGWELGEVLDAGRGQHLVGGDGRAVVHGGDERAVLGEGRDDPRVDVESLAAGEPVGVVEEDADRDRVDVGRVDPGVLEVRLEGVLTGRVQRPVRPRPQVHLRGHVVAPERHRVPDHMGLDPALPRVGRRRVGVGTCADDEQVGAHGRSQGGQAWPSNIEVTEPSSKTSLIARESSGRDREHGELVEATLARDRQGVGDHDLGHRGVLQAVDRGPGEQRVGRGDDDARGAVGHQRLGGGHDRAAGVDHVVDEHADAVVDAADDAVGDDLVGPVLAAGLVDEGQRRAAQAGRPALGHLDPAGVGADHGERLAGVLLPDVVGQDRQRHQVVDGPVEEALDLVGVEVDADQSVGAGGLEEVGHQPRGDGLAAAVLLVLAGVAVERLDDGDPLGRRALEGVDHDQVLHDPLVDRRRVALDHEGVAAAHRLLVADVELGVGERVGRGRHQPGAELEGDRLGELGVCSTAEDHQVLLRGLLQSAHALVSWPGL